jgi:hypothetical protein
LKFYSLDKALEEAYAVRLLMIKGGHKNEKNEKNKRKSLDIIKIKGVMQIAARYDANVRYRIISKLKELESPKNLSPELQISNGI